MQMCFRSTIRFVFLCALLCVIFPIAIAHGADYKVENIKSAKSRVIESNTVINDGVIEKTKIYNNGIMETILINKDTGKMSIDIRPIEIQYTDHIEGKSKTNRRNLSTRHNQETPVSFEDRSHSKYTFPTIGNSQATNIKKGNGNRARSVAVSKKKSIVASPDSGNFVEQKNRIKLDKSVDKKMEKNLVTNADEKLMSSEKKSSDKERAQVNRKIIRMKKFTKKQYGNVYSNRKRVSQLIQSNLKNQSNNRNYQIRRKYRQEEKKIRLAKSKFLAQKNLVYSCRSEGERIRMEVSYLRDQQKSLACEVLYFRSKSYRPVNLGQYRYGECRNEAKLWLEKQKAWGWQCERIL